MSDIKKLIQTAVAIVTSVTGSVAAAADAPIEALQNHWDLLEGYCTSCHNFEDWAGGMSLEGLEPSSVATEAETWEAVISKLNAGMMPPPGEDKPQPSETKSFVTGLEDSIDQLSAQHPHPGSVVLHRLNRTEYANAIEDLLGLKIDPEEYLPRDDESAGFDNIASVLTVSPSFLEQYVLAAREVTVQALGKGNAAATAKVYAGAPGAGQYAHIDGLPLGTRGGMIIEHYFPADGDYEFTVNGLVGAGYVWGVMDPETLIITIDDVKVFQQGLGGDKDLRAVDVEQAKGVGRINDRFKNIRRFVSAGPHRIGITFLQKSAAEHNEILHKFNSVEGMSVLVQGVSDGPRIDNVVVKGPFDPQGVSATPSRKKIFVCYPEVAADELPCAKQIFANIARRAFRRDINENDLAGALAFYQKGRGEGSFDSGIQKGLMAILASPKFLYRAHTPPADVKPGDIFKLNDYELASRLSFFLWSSLPDDELLNLAQQNKLSQPAVLQQQVKRMLADPRAESLVTNFVFQWLHVHGLQQVNPDPILFPQFTNDLLDDFEKELELFVASIFREDRSVIDLLTANHTYVNERLALHYKIDNVRGGQFQRIEWDDPQRWGLLGKGAVLMATSYANRTSPVVRGAYILDKFIGVPAPTPPPNVEAFPETQEGGVNLTVRERLESHRKEASCNACHALIDPLGLALENFNAIGQWRDKDRDAGLAIDASGQLVDGTPLHNPADLRKALTRNPERFVETFTQKLMTFALGRDVKYYDMPTVRAVVRNAAKDDYRFSDIVMGIVNSPAFLMDTYVKASAETQISGVIKTDSEVAMVDQTKAAQEEAAEKN